MPALHVREMPAASRDAALELPEVRIPKLAVIFRVNGSTARNGVSRGACTKLIGESPAKPLHRTQQRARRYPARAKLRNASTMFRMAHPCSVGFQLGPIQVPRLSAPLAEVGKVGGDFYVTDNSSARFSNSILLIRAGVNYKFDWLAAPAPLVAKY
jgi:hypothetical protein